MKFFFLRTRILQVLFCILVCIGSAQLLYGIVVAQSLLSDRAWFLRYIEQKEKINYKLNNISILPSDLFFPPAIPYNKEKNPDLKVFLNPLQSSKINKKLSIPSINKKYNDIKLSKSELIRLFPWFSNQELSNLPNENDDIGTKLEEEEIANMEFSGISMWVSYIQKLINSNPEKALLKFLEIEEKLDVEDRTLLKVQLFYFLNEWSKAEKLAEGFLREWPENKNIPLIFYYLNKSLLAQKKLLNQDLILRETTIKSLEPKLLADFLKILSNEAYLLGDISRALKFHLTVLRNKKTSKFSDRTIVSRLLRELRPYEELQILSKKYPNMYWLQEQIASHQINLLFEKKRFRVALGIVEKRLKFALEINDKEQVRFLHDIQEKLTKSLKINTKKIGIVLPLSSSNSKIARLAQETLNGLWLALHAKEISVRDYLKRDSQKNKKKLKSKLLKNSNLRESSQKIEDTWQLVVRDSQLNEEITKSVIHELVEKEHVIAIIGPLARKTSEAAAEVAQRLRVPLLSLSLTDSIPKLGDYIFRNNKSWKQEVTELIDYAVSELQACRFVILFTKTREGRKKMRHFWNEALKKGCEIVAAEGFKDEGQKSLVNEFDTFTGKNLYMNIDEKNILKELKEKEDPIHNFDAVFVAVGSGGVKNLRLIFPYSSVYKMENIPFLGDSGWNDRAIQFAPGLRGIRRSIFVDSFFLGSKSYEMEMLKNLHERILYRHQNYVGPTAYTAYAFDTLMILLKLINEKPNLNHKELKEALLNMDPLPSVTGNLKFDKYGEIKRELKFLTLRRGKILPLTQEISN